MSQAAADEQAIFAVLKVTRVEFLALQKLSTVESQTLQLVLEFPGIEE
jgi:hypothetical protein